MNSKIFSFLLVFILFAVPGLAVFSGSYPTEWMTPDTMLPDISGYGTRTDHGLTGFEYGRFDKSQLSSSYVTVENNKLFWGNSPRGPTEQYLSPRAMDIMGDERNELIYVNDDNDIIIKYYNDNTSTFVTTDIIPYVAYNDPSEQIIYGWPQENTPLFMINDIDGNSTFYRYEDIGDDLDMDIACSVTMPVRAKAINCFFESGDDNYCYMSSISSGTTRGNLFVIDADNCSVVTNMSIPSSYSSNSEDEDDLIVSQGSLKRYIAYNMDASAVTLIIEHSETDPTFLNITANITGITFPYVQRFINYDGFGEEEIEISGFNFWRIYDIDGNLLRNYDSFILLYGITIPFDINDDGLFDSCYYQRDDDITSYYCHISFGSIQAPFLNETFDDGSDLLFADRNQRYYPLIADVDDDLNPDICVFPYCRTFYPSLMDEIVLNASDYMSNARDWYFVDMNGDTWNDLILTNDTTTIIYFTEPESELPEISSFIFSPENPVCVNSTVFIRPLISDDTQEAYRLRYKCYSSDTTWLSTGFQTPLGDGYLQGFNCTYDDTGFETITFEVTDVSNFPTYNTLDTTTHEVVISYSNCNSNTTDFFPSTPVVDTGIESEIETLTDGDASLKLIIGFGIVMMIMIGAAAYSSSPFIVLISGGLGLLIVTSFGLVSAWVSVLTMLMASLSMFAISRLSGGGE